MHHGNFSSAPNYQYPHQAQNPNYSPNPSPGPTMDHSNASFASAPPYSSGYDYSGYSASYAPPYSQSADPAPAPSAAPSYSTPATNPNLQSFNSSAPVTNPNLQSYNSIAPVTNSNLQSFNSASPATSLPPFESHVNYQTPTPTPPPTHQHQQSYFPSYDQHQTNPNYMAPTNPIPSPTPNSAFSAPYGAPPAPIPLPYDNSYENYSKYDQAGVFFDDRLGGFNQNRPESGSNLYGKQQYDDGGYSDGVYAYQGGKSEPYGARGTAPNSSSSTLFDDYGRSINPSSVKSSAPIASSKIVRAVPKADSQQDSKGGVQKFRVKVLTESGGQSTMDVLCQIGLDGIRMLEPSTSRTLRIYPLENITRCEKMDSSTLAVWSKSSADIEPRRVRLQSNSYTTNTLLDTVTAATVQLKEMGGSTRRSDSFKASEPPVERKKGIADWMNIIKPPNEEKDHWVPDEAVTKCSGCGSDFGAFLRKHHCRNCGDIFCDKCTNGRITLTAEDTQPVRVCDRCMAEVTQRLSNAKEGANKPAGLQSHEDLARKLQEEMEKNRKSSTGSKSEGSGRRMREVACPICTVHLQVQVPSSGSETIECGVCQNPFLVSAH